MVHGSSIYYSWSRICIPLILVSPSMKIASTSATMIHSNIESEQPWLNPWMRVRLIQETIYFDFRLDIDGSNFDNVNEFIPVTELAKEKEMQEKMKFQSSQSKALRKAKEIAARGLSRVFGRSGLKFSLLQRFLNLFYSLEILMFSCVVEFL